MKRRSTLPLAFGCLSVSLISSCSSDPQLEKASDSLSNVASGSTSSQLFAALDNSQEPDKQESGRDAPLYADEIHDLVRSLSKMEAHPVLTELDLGPEAKSVVTALKASQPPAKPAPFADKALEQKYEAFEKALSASPNLTEKEREVLKAEIILGGK